MMQLGALRLDLERKQVSASGKSVPLEPQECKALALLMRNNLCPVPYEVFENALRKSGANITKVVRTRIGILRIKLATLGYRNVIAVMPNYGYVFVIQHRHEDLRSHAGESAHRRKV